MNVSLWPMRARNRDQMQRLKRLREISGMNQLAFAAYLGISPPRWNNYETQGLPLSVDVAMRLIQRIPGLTLDWLYLGKADGLPLQLARKLEESKARTHEAG